MIREEITKEGIMNWIALEEDKIIVLEIQQFCARKLIALAVKSD